ncbi:DinB family protein [Ekhidna sp.]|uniref:DinB family protein n=1 Tax=Ekhidna sp. TaxID=2608089 RepID=UPI003BA92FE7
MQFDLEKSTPILERTPDILNQLLRNLPNDWVSHNEGPDTWSPFDVVGHLIHGENTDWIPRVKIILAHGDTEAFEPFDRFAQYELSKGKTLDSLLDEFQLLRKKNIQELKGLKLTDQDLLKTGRHPELGIITLKNLLAAWVVHDLGHINQITRVMAKQYTHEVGVWTQYMKVLGKT